MWKRFVKEVDEWWENLKEDVREYEKPQGIGRLNVSERSKDIASAGFDRRRHLQEEGSLLKSKKS